MPIEELLPHFINASVQGIPLVAVVMAAVYWVKGLGVRGNALRVTSMAIGLVLGVGYQLSALTGPLPVGTPAFAIYFGIVFYGFALGLVASLLIDIGVDVLAKALRSLGVIALSSPLNIAALAAEPLRLPEFTDDQVIAAITRWYAAHPGAGFPPPAGAIGAELAASATTQAPPDTRA